MVDAPLYYYLQNPASVTRNYLPDYMDTFRKFYADKSALAARYGLDDDDPEWRESTCWAGLLIAIGNEFAAGNPATMQGEEAQGGGLCAGERDGGGDPEAEAPGPGTE